MPNYKESNIKGNTMKSGARDQVEGKLHEAKGHVKGTVGEHINGPYLEIEGNVEKKEGKVQKR